MQKIVDETKGLNTTETLKQDLRSIGIKSGMTVFVHCSMSKIGWVNGGSVGIVQALMEAVSEEGTLVMPTQSSDWSDPSQWCAPAVPKEWHQTIRETMPVYDPRTTPTRGMGSVAESFRTFPYVKRSSHPMASFAAWGKEAEYIIENHSLDYPLGEQSPLARLYDKEAYVLFIGTTYDTNTSFHLGEYRSSAVEIIKNGAPLIENGQRIWKKYKDIEFNDEQFPAMGNEFEKEHEVHIGKIGHAESRLFSLVDSVDYSTAYFKTN